MAVSQYVNRQTHIFGDQFEYRRKSEVRFYIEKERDGENLENQRLCPYSRRKHVHTKLSRHQNNIQY